MMGDDDSLVHLESEEMLFQVIEHQQRVSGLLFEFPLIGFNSGAQVVERVSLGPHLIELGLPFVADEILLVQCGQVLLEATFLI